ncbi:MAG: glycosyltransferase family 39 protein, partial [Bacteroidales bacterium]|nr:glycosyltransferase family 39 protein [Bacteroidales bacterium]
MKNIYSLLACCVVSIILLQYRVSHSDIRSDIPLKVTTWDAFGYYMYLPSIFIYQDITDLKWLPEVDSKYSVTGGKVYQAEKNENGDYVFKYLIGVSIMESPFFLLGHLIAENTKHEADGFSPPYQYAIAFGAVIFCILAIFLLRTLLLRFFSDRSTAISLVLLVTATNLIQYVSIDSGMSHSYIFPLYVIVIYTTIKWHSKPSILWASLTGLTIGLATICRPTEAIMLFIPLLWNTQTKEVSKAKWNQVKKYKIHILYAVIFGFIGILPQLIYWKIASGSFIYNVGSKWVFLNPFFRVLFGWESGWFIYTPITIFFILGF